MCRDFSLKRKGGHRLQNSGEKLISVDHSMEPDQHILIHQLLENSSEQYPDTVCLIYKDIKVSYGELNKKQIN